MRPTDRAAQAEEGIRLAKRVAAMRGVSRREAELLIENGAVRVDGRVVEVPAHRVRDAQQVEVAADARPTVVEAVTLLLHKPAGVAFDAPLPRLLVMTRHSGSDRSQRPPLQRHFGNQQCFTPLETGASGLIVFTQELRVERKLVEDAGLIENEVMVDVAGPVEAGALHRLNQSSVIDGRAMLPAKVSINRQADGVTGLRFAVKGSWPGQIAQLCDMAGLHILAMKRIRVGRLALAGLAPGEWRFMAPGERV
jgi:23S rRNA pseudouridine2604 synthase